MKVLTTCFFKDSARYFDFLESETNKRAGGENTYYNISIYPCAHYYWRSRGRHSVFLPLMKECAGEATLEDNESLIEGLISFNQKALALNGLNNSARLKRQAVKYLNLLDAVFKREQFDLLISSGDTRLVPEIVIYLAKKYSVKIIYFEQGPFNTVMFDSVGCNADIAFNPSFRELTDSELSALNKIKENIISAKIEKYWVNSKRNPFERGLSLLTFLAMYPGWLHHLTPPELQLGESFSESMFSVLSSKLRFFKKPYSKLEYSSSGKEYITLFLQIPVDAQFLNYSPNYNCFFEMVSDVIDALPEGFDLIVREHPGYRGRYDNRIYKIISEVEGVYLGNEVSLSSLIRGSKLCVVNNSSVGIEAILIGCKVFTFGSSYYSHKGITYDYDKDLNLKGQLIDAIGGQVEKSKIDSFLYEFLVEYLNDGNFQAKNLNYPKKLLC